jgi:calmodulin
MANHTDIPADKVAETREVFNYFDTNNNGKIEASEFRNLLIALGGEVIEGEVEAGMTALDTNRNGTIEWDEFIVWWVDRL